MTLGCLSQARCARSLTDSKVSLGSISSSRFFCAWPMLISDVAIRIVTTLSRLVEGPVHEHPSGTCRQPASYVRKAGHDSVGRVEREAGLVGDVVEDQCRPIAGEREAEDRRVVGGCDLRPDAILEGHSIVVRL